MTELEEIEKMISEVRERIKEDNKMINALSAVKENSETLLSYLLGTKKELEDKNDRQGTTKQ